MVCQRGVASYGIYHNSEACWGGGGGKRQGGAVNGCASTCLIQNDKSSHHDGVAYTDVGTAGMLGPQGAAAATQSNNTVVQGRVYCNTQPSGRTNTTALSLGMVDVVEVGIRSSTEDHLLQIVWSVWGQSAECWSLHKSCF